MSDQLENPSDILLDKVLEIIILTVLYCDQLVSSTVDKSSSGLQTSTQHDVLTISDTGMVPPLYAIPPLLCIH